MKSKLNQNLCTGIMMLLVTFCFIPALSLAGTPGDQPQKQECEKKGHPGPVLGIWRDSEMIQQLALTDNQTKQIRDIDFIFREKQLALKAQHDSFQLQLDKALSDDKIDNAAILEIAESISDINGKLFVQRVESRLALGKILTAKQIKQMNLYDMQPKRKRPAPLKEHKTFAPCAQPPSER
jgi:Spy/CpxP family protein refolding chaperone